MNPFEYKEKLPLSALKKLPEGLRIADDGKNAEILLILRILSGAAKLICPVSGKEINCRKNYFREDLKTFNRNWPDQFPKLISENCTLNELVKLSSNSNSKNRIFYHNINMEISNFIRHSHNKKHTNSFIYIYRFLEKSSFSFPVIYSARTKDFNRGFKEIKEFMAGKEKGELGFFRTFVKSLYAEDAISDTKIAFSFSKLELSRSYSMKMYSATKSIFESYRIDFDSEDEDMSILVNYIDVGSALVAVRNRFFHFSNDGQRNFSGEDIVDCDLYFSALNDMFMHWMSTILLGILNHVLSERN